MKWEGPHTGGSNHRGWHHSLGWDPELYKKEEVSWTPASISLPPDCGWNVISSPKLLLLSLSHHDGLCNLRLWVMVNTFPLSCFCQDSLSQTQEKKLRQGPLETLTIPCTAQNHTFLILHTIQNGENARFSTFKIQDSFNFFVVTISMGCSVLII